MSNPFKYKKDMSGMSDEEKAGYFGYQPTTADGQMPECVFILDHDFGLILCDDNEPNTTKYTIETPGLTERLIQAMEELMRIAWDSQLPGCLKAINEARAAIAEAEQAR